MMKELALLMLTMVSVVIVGSSSIDEASSLSYGRKETKSWPDRRDEAPRICLDSTINLRPCNFGGGDSDGETHSKRARSLGGFPDPLDDPAQGLSAFRELPETESSRNVIIVYRIQGCLPSRLPFNLPTCRQSDFIGKIVQVQQLLPFKIIGNANKKPANDHAQAPLVFPELKHDEWLEMMKGSWSRQTKDGDDVEAKKLRDGSQSESNVRKLTKRWKFEDDDDVKADKRKSRRKKFESARVTNEMLELRRLMTNRETRLDNDVANFYMTGSAENELWTDERNVNQLNNNFLENDAYEFPYEKAIPYDPEKLQAAKPGSEFPYAQAIPYDPEKLQAAKPGSEFPYAKAIPYDPEKLQTAKPGSEFPYAQAIPYDPEKLHAAKPGSEFPYAQAIPYDPEKLYAAKPGSEFPYAQAIPYDPEKLYAVKPGSEFPYAQAIPYDPEKLRAAKPGSEFPYAQAIPYDPKKLRLAKPGSEFPYAQAIIYDPKKLRAAKPGSEFP